MSVRLGFAVATAWEPTVLLVDEALAVGDEQFQRKCAARIDTFREQGATVIFVSHNLPQVKAMCTRAIWLESGVVRRAGSAADVVDAYLDAVA
jgi:lipopolysaccharide transport system ATP-binding protein